MKKEGHLLPITRTTMSSKIESALRELFVEKVGHSMLDSGGAYGYQHDANEKNPPWEKPIITFSLASRGSSETEISVSINTYIHFLTCLDITEESEKVRAEYEAFCAEEEQVDDSHFENMTEFSKQRANNTYNYDNPMDHVFQYVEFTRMGKDKRPHEFVILQLHLGCDVRGGYSKPRVFELTVGSGMLSSGPDLEIFNSSKEAGGSWRVYNGHDAEHIEFYMGNEEFKKQYGHTLPGQALAMIDHPLHKIPIATEPEFRGKGFIWENNTGDAWHCPFTGTKLTAHASWDY